MAVSIKCSICDKHIRDVAIHEVKALTGKELCDVCKDRMDEIFKEVDERVISFKKAVEKTYTEFKRTIEPLDRVYQKFVADGTSMRTTTMAELKALIGDLTK